MRKLTLDFRDLHRSGPAFFDYLKLRKRFFVDALGWDIPHDHEVEMDQYDNPTARYALVLGDGGTVLAGARALPLDARWGSTTSMLRDARSGQMKGIPAALMSEEEMTARSWECTRLVISPDVRGAAARRECLGLICEGLVDMALAQGAERLVSLSNLWLLRSLKQLGYDAELVSAPYVNAEDGHRYAVMGMTAMRLAPRDLPRIIPGVGAPAPTITREPVLH
ncbi:acyl-homoserine-lactone synthase [Pelagovum pacificum]|uniref:Autoinducer synthase n=1 Tax=Pelagovum pacificum TaxID=2588711 RepID=A0A5C5GEG5_9RHOB|nr:acyl-homoserine-lactone synthase [Pelagovum pacificum]QQA44284.1 autoinducer synthase [Pelagovum pacificum]TNY32594.1 autoinducer synthase [Pelagovum pacificum]